MLQNFSVNSIVCLWSDLKKQQDFSSLHGYEWKDIDGQHVPAMGFSTRWEFGVYKECKGAF